MLSTRLWFPFCLALTFLCSPHNLIWGKAFSLTLMQAVSAARTPWITVWSRFCAFFTRISSDDLHPGVTALTLERHHAPLGSHEIFACLIFYWKYCHLNKIECVSDVGKKDLQSELLGVKEINMLSHLEMMVSWLEMVRICSAITQSSSVQCLSKQWSAMTRTNRVIDWPLEMRSFADVTKASLVYR